MVARGAPKNAPRGPASKRHDRTRKDKDGDLAMGLAIKGRGGITKSSARPAGTDGAARTTRRGVLAAGAQRQILKHVGAGDVAMRETRSTAPRGLMELKITGWTKSKASSSADGGVSSLISWLEKKASSRLGSRARYLKVKKSRVEGEELIISIPAEDVGAVLRLNGYLWAGKNITVKRAGDNGTELSSGTVQVKDMIKGVLERRYNLEEKLLDLSSLGQDPELQAKEVFNQKSTTSKFFPAMMKILEEAFDTPQEKDAAIVSVTLANNELSDLTFVTTLSTTLPKIQNLDLSGNKIDNVNKLAPWRRRLERLTHLVVAGNPFEQSHPDFAKTLINWFPKLQFLNGIQVRTEEEIVNRSKTTELPFPIRSPQFQDEGGIVENFVRTFFTGFDTDRNTLVGLYYDNSTTFSYALNTAAPRDPANSEKTEKQEWGEYIKHSRNLRKVTHLPARVSRQFTGQTAIAEVFAGMPKSKHPDLASEARKWMIEAHIQPGVQDPSGQSTSGVDGFMVVIHGEFDEVVGTMIKKRSFDRTFILGPGGQSGVRIVTETYTVRAFGGAQAFELEQFEANGVPTDAVAAQLPMGVTLQVAEQMITELQKQTKMTVVYAKECLEQVGWDFQSALQAFAQVKPTLPADAFVQGI